MTTKLVAEAGQRAGHQLAQPAETLARFFLAGFDGLSVQRLSLPDEEAELTCLRALVSAVVALAGAEWSSRPCRRADGGAEGGRPLDDLGPPAAEGPSARRGSPRSSRWQDPPPGPCRLQAASQQVGEVDDGVRGQRQMARADKPTGVLGMLSGSRHTVPTAAGGSPVTPARHRSGRRCSWSASDRPYGDHEVRKGPGSLCATRALSRALGKLVDAADKQVRERRDPGGGQGLAESEDDSPLRPALRAWRAARPVPGSRSAVSP